MTSALVIRGLIVGSETIKTLRLNSAEGQPHRSLECGCVPSCDYYRTVEEARILELLCISGWAEEYRTAPDGTREAARETLERLVASGLPFRRVDARTRAFDPAELINFAKLLGLRNEDEFWEHRYVATGRRLVEAFSEGPEHAHFALRLERRFNLAHHDVGAKIRLHLPLPIEDDTLRDLVVTPVTVEDAGSDSDVQVEHGRIAAYLRVPTHRIASIAAEIAFSCHPERGRGTAVMPELEIYLRPNEGIVQTTPRVTELAKQLGITARDPLDGMRAVWNYLIDEMTLGVIHYDRLPSESALDWVLDAKLFDCRLGAALIVALCRASGMPARLRSGYTLYNIPFYHYWVEVWADERGWLPFDLICWDLSLRGRDPVWQEVFFGALDARMTTEILPLSFTGFPSVHFPHAWHMLSRPLDRGAAFGLFSVETGALAYEDALSFTTNAGPLLP